MPEYRRSKVEGGTYFFTVVTYHRLPILTNEIARGILHSAWINTKQRFPFETLAVCLLPDHLHCIWTLPPDDGDFATRWRLVKTWFTRHCDPALRALPDRARAAKAQQALWQHRYWEHLLRDEADFNRHVEYIHPISGS
jgi:putative transposase